MGEKRGVNSVWSTNEREKVASAQHFGRTTYHTIISAPPPPPPIPSVVRFEWFGAFRGGLVPPSILAEGTCTQTAKGVHHMTPHCPTAPCVRPVHWGPVGKGMSSGAGQKMGWKYHTRRTKAPHSMERRPLPWAEGGGWG